MTRILRLACLITVLTCALAAPGMAAQQPGAPCTTYTNGGISDSLEWGTIERVMEASAVIVDATVSAVAPGSANRTPAPFPPDTDVTLIASRVLKGPSPSSSFVVPQRAEINAFEMKPGQRFILFMDPLGDQHYRSDRFALLCIDENRVRMARDVYRAGFNNRPLSEVENEIRGYLELPRIRGRIALDNGQFPPPNAILDLPTPDVDHRGRLRVRLTLRGEQRGLQARGSAAVYAPASNIYPSTAASAGIEIPPRGEPAPRLFAIDNSGTFELPAAPGTYEVAVEGIPFGYAVSAIRFGGRALTDGTIEVERDAATDLAVTLGPTTTGMRVDGRISGIPTDVPAETFSVLMIPEASGAAAGVTRPARDGTYAFTQVPPGRYTLKTMAARPPAGTTWGTLSSTVVTVERDPLLVDFPLFAGAEGRARTLDAAGNVNPQQPATLRFDNDRGTRIYVSVVGGAARFWLPRGAFYVTASGTGGYARVTSNGASLFTTPIRSDGVTPLPPIDVVVEREAGR